MLSCSVIISVIIFVLNVIKIVKISSFRLFYVCKSAFLSRLFELVDSAACIEGRKRGSFSSFTTSILLFPETVARYNFRFEEVRKRTCGKVLYIDGYEKCTRLVVWQRSLNIFL